MKRLASTLALVLLGATVHSAEAPAPRRRADVEAVLRAVSPDPGAVASRLRILLVAGPKDHGPGEHDYPKWQKDWAPLLAKATNVQITTAFPWPTPEQWDDADLAVFYLKTQWNADQLAQIKKHQERGGGLVTIHWAIGCDGNWQHHARHFGLSYKSASYRHGHVNLQLTLPDHPIARGLPRQMPFVDEPYWPFIGDPAQIRVLATSEEKIHQGDDRRQNPGDDTVQNIPVFWTYEPTGTQARVFVSIFGHYMWTFDDPFFRLLLLRGMAWSARGNTDLYRFDTLATDGVPLRD
jgi:type 1 glutamine amidotransferase